jgi:hypothetical protein
MAKAEKSVESSKSPETTTATLDHVRVTLVEFAEMLTQSSSFELSGDKKLILHDLNVNDFLTMILASDQPTRLKMFLQMMNRLSMEINLEGSIALGEFNIADHSWTLSAGNGGFLKFISKPTTVVKSLNEIVSFLNLLAPGSGFALKPRQDLLVTGLSQEAMLEYYRLCQETEDAVAREKGQDELFAKANQTLDLKGLTFRIYGLNAEQVNRTIDMNAGGILYKATENKDGTQPNLILALLPKQPS